MLILIQILKLLRSLAPSINSMKFIKWIESKMTPAKKILEDMIKEKQALEDDLRMIETEIIRKEKEYFTTHSHYGKKRRWFKEMWLKVGKDLKRRRLRGRRISHQNGRRCSLLTAQSQLWILTKLQIFTQTSSTTIMEEVWWEELICVKARMLRIRKVKEKQGAIIVIQMINTLSDSTQNKYLSNAKRSSDWKALCPISPNVS